MSMKTNRKGFTVTELIIVIAVIAVLAAVLIPTFTSLIKKSNESVDIRLVREMNTILKAEEATGNVPASTVDVENILKSNGINTVDPTTEGYLFYWDYNENCVLLYDSEIDEAVFPKEYKGQPFVEGYGWLVLGGTEVVTFEELGVASLEEAILAAEEHQVVTLTEDITFAPEEGFDNALDTDGKPFSHWNKVMPDGTQLDLNGHTITTEHILYASINGSLVIRNGNVVLKDASLFAQDGSTLTLENVKLTTTNTRHALVPYGNAAEVNIVNCDITTMGTILMTNARNGGEISNNVVVNIVNSKLRGTAEAGKRDGGSPIHLNVDCELKILNSTIEGYSNAVFMRAGHAYIENSTLIHTMDDLGVARPGWDADEKTWETLPNAAIVVGDIYKTAYNWNASCTLVNTTIQGADGYELVYLAQHEGYTTEYNGSYEYFVDPKSDGVIKVNGSAVS